MTGIEAFLARYGLFALFAGAGIEGEAVVITGGALAAQGYFPLWAAMIAATLGSSLVDQLWFFLARYSRGNGFVERATGRPAFARALRFIERHPSAFILAFRFIYGMRTVSPIALGMSQVETKRFVILNLVAASIWAALFILIGYELGPATMAWLYRIPAYAIVPALLALVALALGAGYLIKRKRG